MNNEIVQFFNNDLSINVNAWTFSVNLILAALLAFILSRVYTRFGNSLSDRKSFGRNFILLAVTTMLVITIVKSSLALSLGLVGALSIVRFRSAIKEPEELAYVFLAIAIGLGLGAGQRLITILAFFLIIIIVIITRLAGSKSSRSDQILLNVISNSEIVKIEDIFEILNQQSNAAKLRRVEEREGRLDALFVVELSNVDALSKLRSLIMDKDKNAEITFLDNQGLY